MLTEEEQLVLFEAAEFHNDFGNSDSLEAMLDVLIKKTANPSLDDLDSILKRLIDFECLTRFRKDHDLSDELAEKALAIAAARGITQEKDEEEKLCYFRRQLGG